MDENTRIIHHEPLARYGSLRRQRGDVRVFPDALSNTAIDPLKMRFRRSGADDKKIGERRNPAQVENYDVLGFLVFS
jgi:hypothetical protein